MKRVAEAPDPIGSLFSGYKEMKDHKKRLSEYGDKKAGADRAPHRDPDDVGYWESYWDSISDYSPFK